MNRILFITSNDHVPWGGSEELWLQCSLEALKQGFDVGICVRWKPLPAKLEEVGKMYKVQWFQKEKAQPVFARTYNKLAPQILKIKQIPYTNEILKWRPHLVVISQGNNADGLNIMQFCIENNLNYCTISQAVYEGGWPNSVMVNFMQKGFTNAVANYFVSEANLRLTTLQICADVKNARVIRNPFNVNYNNILPFPDTANFKIACVARYEFYAKGQDVLLEVMNDKKWKERNFFVTFYGKGPNEDNIRRLINYFNLKNVSIGGHKSTDDIWRENHALILPSRFEGLPLALVEAMLAGRFGIVSNVSGNREVFVDGESGFLAEAPKAEYLDQAMERAWQRRHDWEIIGEVAKQYIRTLVPENPGKEFFYTLMDDYSRNKSIFF